MLEESLCNLKFLENMEQSRNQGIAKEVCYSHNESTEKDTVQRFATRRISSSPITLIANSVKSTTIEAEMY
jgi:hypothetical protein